jgi:hypothetical protein
VNQQLFRSNFQDALNGFKEFMDTYTSLSANILIQNIHVVCLLSVAIESVDERSKKFVIQYEFYLVKLKNV